MHWRDDGVLLAAHRLGETAATLDVFTEFHGRHAGYLHGASSRRISTFLQPGTQLSIAWRARLHEHMGYFKIEPVHVRACDVLANPLALIALSSICALLSRAMPEREADPDFYHRSIQLMDRLAATDTWFATYLEWELSLLEVLGMGLDLTRCAATGHTRDLCYVSPKTGRAVSRAGAGRWEASLLPLPACLLGRASASIEDFASGLTMTGHFLTRALVAPRNQHPLPDPRQLLLATSMRRARSQDMAAKSPAA